MSTLSEIEAAVDTVPREEQKTLLNRRSSKLNGARPIAAGDIVTAGPKRKRWLEELRQLRERNASGRVGVPLQEVMDGLRAERILKISIASHENCHRSRVS